MNKITGLIRLMRLELPISAGVCVVLGQLFALDKLASVWLTISGFLSIVLVSSSILVLNDYFDVESDKINAPDRPIPPKLVTPSEALIFSLFLLLTGLLLSWVIGIPILIISIILAVIGFLYNRYFKKSGFWGNLMVSFSVGMTFVYGGASVGMPFEKPVLFFGIIAALVDLGEEIAADAMDMQGDMLINSGSIAIKHGKKTARRVSTVIFFCVILLTFVPFILNWFILLYLIPIAIMDFTIAFCTVRLWKAKQNEERKYIRAIYLGATFGLLVFLMMRLFGI